MNLLSKKDDMYQDKIYRIEEFFKSFRVLFLVEQEFASRKKRSEKVGKGESSVVSEVK